MITDVSCEDLPTSDNYIASAGVDLLGEILGGRIAPNSSAASPTIRPSAMPST